MNKFDQLYNKVLLGELYVSDNPQTKNVNTTQTPNPQNNIGGGQPTQMVQQPNQAAMAKPGATVPQPPASSIQPNIQPKTQQGQAPQQQQNPGTQQQPVNQTQQPTGTPQANAAVPVNNPNDQYQKLFDMSQNPKTNPQFQQEYAKLDPNGQKGFINYLTQLHQNQPVTGK